MLIARTKKSSNLAGSSFSAVSKPILATKCAFSVMIFEINKIHTCVHLWNPNWKNTVCLEKIFFAPL